MKTQLIPILAIDVITGAFFGLLKANNASTEVIPLFVAASLFAILSIVSLIALITLPANRKSTTVVLLLCILRVCEFALASTTLLSGEHQFRLTQVWLGSFEYVLAIFLLVRIPTEYFSHVNTTYFPAFDDHRSYPKEDLPTEGACYLVEGPAAVTDVHAPLAASGGFTEIDFGSDSLNISMEMAKRPKKLPHPKSIRRREVSPGSSPPGSPSPDPEEPALKKQTLELLRPPQLLLFLEKFCVLAICISATLTCVIVMADIRNPSSWDSNALVKVLLLTCVWSSLGFGIALLSVQVVKLQKITFQGYFFGTTHAHGVVLMVSLVGWIVSFTYSFILLLIGTPLEAYLPNTGGNSFISCARAIFTQIIPLGFHFYNIFRDDMDKKSNVSNRMKFAYFLVMVNLHWMVVGHVFTQGPVNPTLTALATSARAAAFASAVDFCFVIMALLSPLAHAFIQFFNLGMLRLSIHQIHLHRSLVVSGCIFAFIHVILHVISWAIDPSLSFNDTYVYRLDSISYISGLLMLVGLIGAGVTGYELSINLSAPISSKSHLPFSALFFFAFFVHGYEHVMGDPLGDYIIITTSLICIASFMIFFFALPVRRMEVDFRQSVWGDVIRENQDHFTFLSLKYGSSTTIPPGSFFNIYGVYGSLLSYTHGHPFPVFSSRNGNVEFLIHCRKAKQQDHISFTQQLLVLRPELIYIQGPFQGPATAFVDMLGNISSPAHLYLCGWNGGFANVFALLEYMKAHGPNYAVKSLTCIFNRLANIEVQRKVYARVSALVSDWESNIPVSILEAPDTDLRHVLTAAERQNKQIFKSRQELMEIWRESMGGCNRWVVLKETVGQDEEEIELSNRKRSGTFGDSGKILYFCGGDFNYDMFGEGWTYHVETIPF